MSYSHITSAPNAKPRYRVLRYLAVNPGQDIPASYNASMDDKPALAHACFNAKRFGGQVICEYADGEQKVVKDYSWIE